MMLGMLKFDICPTSWKATKAVIASVCLGSIHHADEEIIL